MLKKLFATLVLLVCVSAGCILFLASKQPLEYQTYQEITIAAPADVIFDNINFPRKMEKWNTWFSADSKIQLLYSGSESGIGATLHWESSTERGTGSATVIESEQNAKVSYQLNYLKPLQTTQFMRFILTDTSELSEPRKQQTLVRWEVQGLHTFTDRVKSIFFNTEEDIRKQLTMGLDKLKSITESPSPQI